MCLGMPRSVPLEQNASMSQNEHTPGETPETVPNMLSNSSPANCSTMKVSKGLSVWKARMTQSRQGHRERGASML